MNTRRLPYSLFRLGLVCFWLTVLLFRQTTFAKTHTAPCNSIFYVKANATGANSGSSWADAFTSLQDALAVACSGAQIWVAAGTYKPTADPSGNTSPADPRTKTFVMKNGVAIYGGFPNSGMPVMANRNLLANPTILSGDIGNMGVDTDNSYRVINNTFTSASPLNNTAILDGVIVEKGYADGNFPLNLGGGMWNAYASPKVQNCVFRNNFAVAGGGMFNDNSSSNITNCLFLNNTVTTAGAGISNGGGTDMVKVINCTFYGNAGPTTIANERAATSISNSIIWGNSGGISNGLVSYSIVQGGFFGMNNVNVDPRFVNAAGGDFRLQQYSPAIDAGTNTDAPITDFEGNARPFNATGINKADMGAYEYQSTYDFCATYDNTTGEVLNISTTVRNRLANVSVWRACGLSKVRITAKGSVGGPGGNSEEVPGGAGATMIGEFILLSGQILQAVAGAPGAREGGGGGSGVQISGGNLLILAGAGGGGAFGGSVGKPGQITTGSGNGGSGNIGTGGGGGGFYSGGGGGYYQNSFSGGGGGFAATGGFYSLSGFFGGGGFGAGGSGYSGSGGGGGYDGGSGTGYGTGANGGGSYNIGSNQNNTAGANNAGGQVIIEYLGTATYSATVTPTQPTCTQLGSISIDFTGDFNNNTSGGLEYAIVAGNSFTGTPTFADITADPFNVTSGTGTMVGTYTVRVRLKYNPTLYVDNTYTLFAPTTVTPTVGGSSNPTTCGGSEGTISLNGFLNNTTYSVSYKKNDVVASAANFTSNGSGVLTLTGLGAGSYTDIVATYGTCVSNAVTATLEDPAKPSLTLGTIPAICAGATTFSVPYNNPTGSPNKYSITGMGITTVTDVDLTNPITVQLSGPASGSPIPFTLTVKNSTTRCVSNSTLGSVTVDPVSVGGSISGSATVCSGTNSTVLTLSGQVGNVQKWQSSLSSDFSGAVDISNTTTELTASNLTQTTYYRAVVKSGVCSQATSTSATVTVNSVSVGGSVSGSATVCSGTNSTTLTLSGQVGNVQKWQSSLSSDFSGAVDISNTTTEVTVSNLTQTTYYRVVVKSGVCSEATSTSATVTVNSVSVGGSVSDSATVCSGTNSTTLTLSGQVGNIQKWQSSLSSDFSGAVDISNTTTELIESNLTQTTYYRAVVKSGVCSQANSVSATVTVDPVSVGGSISGSATVCSGTNSTVLTLSGQVGNVQKWQSSLSSDFSGAVDIANTTTELTASNLTQTTYYRAVVKSGVCSEANSVSATVQVQVKPTIMLTTLQQTLNEGNSQVFCDTDANPVNGLQFTVSGLCVSGNPVWRVQVGSGAWSDWSPNVPVSQSSNNQPHRYQAACDASCPVTYSNPIELTINYRASTPQNVSLVADGVSVNAGETKEVCNIEGNAITFNATCGVGEVLLYSVDGAEYSSTLPVQLVDGQYHNYRVRCRKSDGTVSCVETESGVMRLRIVSSSLVAPVASLNVTSGCGSPVPFSGTANCGALTTVWYNAATNVALSSLPNQTPTETTSYYARCQAGGGCLSEKSNVVTYNVIPVGVAPAITASQDIVCTGTTVKISANCPAGSQTFWNTGVTAPSFEVAFSNVTKQSYWAKCLFEGGCQSAESVRKDVYWNAFVVTLINIGESKSAVKVNDRAAWSSQFITRDGGPELEQSTQVNPTLYYVENANKQAPRYWTINVEACGLSTDGSLTFDMLATPEMGVLRSFNTHENNAPYFMYANREGWTELYAQNHPAYGFYQDNGAGGNVYDAGLPKGLYKLGIRYWDQKGWGSIYPSTRKAQGNVLAYQEYWFRIQSKDGVGVGAAREGANGKWQWARGEGQGAFATVLPNPVTNILRLKVQESKGKVVQTTLTDAAGRDVLNRQFVPETNTHQEEFGVSALPTGIYFLKVTISEKQATLKVVKVE